MTGPIDAVKAIHNAFRQEMAGIDAAALAAAHGVPGLSAAVERFRFFNEVLVWHAHGGGAGVYSPPLKRSRPWSPMLTRRTTVAARRVRRLERRGLRRRRPADGARRPSLRVPSRHSPVLYRIVRERVSLPDQGKALGLMSSAAPQERFPEVIAWMLPLIGDDDRENMVRI